LKGDIISANNIRSNLIKNCIFAAFTKLLQTLNYTIQEKNIFVLILICIASFTAFNYSQEFELNKSKFSALNLRNIFVNWLVRKMGGLLFLGLLPFAVVVIWAPGYLQFLYIPISNNTISWLLALCALFFTINLVIARFPRTWRQQPQIKLKNWHLRELLVLFIGWAVYLLGYEFFFRGILFFPLAAQFGVFPAIALNVFIYGLAHLNQGTTETTGAMLFGFLFCACAASTGSFWVSYITHLFFAISGSLLILYFNPETKIVFKKQQG
jgi:membrane protease YdiL (CAAX protease family)